jgi:hypothetical protein
MHEQEKKYRITYDSWQGYYEVHTPSGGVKFFKDDQGLPYINLDESGQEAAVMLLETAMTVELEKSKEGLINVQTVWENYEGCTKREILKAKEARQAQGLIGNPSKSNFRGMVREDMIRNFPITSDDVTNARAIFGPDLVSIRGEMVRQTPAPVVADYVEVPQSLGQNNKVVTMAADIFFCGWDCFSHHSILVHQVCHGRAPTSKNGD